MSSTSSTRSRPEAPLRLAVLGALAVSAAGGLLHLAGRDLLSALPAATLCPFKFVTGLPCPGCGMTHAFLALGRLDFAGAWSHNPLSFPLLALMLLYAAGRVPAIARAAGAQRLALAGVLLFWGGRLLNCLR